MARILAAAAAMWLMPLAASAQDRLASAPLQMGLPSAALDRVPLDEPAPRDLFRTAPGTSVMPVYPVTPPWWAPPPQVVYVPVIVPRGFDPRATQGVQTPAAAPPAPVAPAPRAAPGPPRTFYLIPRCYAGDRLPDPDVLPPGCDIADVRVLPPRTP